MLLLYLLLGVTALTATVQNIIKQRFNEKINGSAFFFSAATSFFALLFFIVINLVYEKDFYYGAELILPSLGFAVAYASATVFTQLALLYGPLAKTALITSCSLLLPSLYGIFVQGVYLGGKSLSDALTPTLIIGTLCLIASLILINTEKKSPDAPKEKITLKWIIFIVLAFIGNGACSVVQTAKTDFLGSKGNANFMIVALAAVVASLVIAALCFKREREKIKVTLTKGTVYSAACGIANGLTNFLVIFLNSRNFPASVLFPVVSAGGMVLIFLFSFFIKKERFTNLQYIGYALGVAALVLLNI